MSGPLPSDLRSFDENSPRPPVPGEERQRTVNCREPGPDVQHRRSTLYKGQKALHASCNVSAPLGFEPDGRCDSSSVMESSADSLLACLQWSRSLHYLLEDAKGLELFEKYLQQEGDVYTLSFWFACEGLKEERDPNRLHTISRALFRRFFQRPQLALPEGVKREIKCSLREGCADKRVIDLAQREVQRLMEETFYPNFLRSDVYLHYVQKCQSSHADNYGQKSMLLNERSTSPEDRNLEYGCTKANFLPTLHEDSEFIGSIPHETPHPYHHNNQQQSDFNKSEMRLTKDVLMATQQLRAQDARPKPEAFAGVYLQPGASPYHATISRPRPQYSSYNPVSRQDSELQSLSSDARTESDNLSLTDASMDGVLMSKRSNRKQFIRQNRAIKQSALINRDPMAHEAVIPRTQRISREQTQPLAPEAFARVLIEKLEVVRQAQEREEMWERKWREVVGSKEDSRIEPKSDDPGLTEAFKQKLQLEDDDDQDILDQHVSRVWSDLTPSRSPKLASPRPRSPEKKKMLQQQLRSDHNFQRSSYRQRKEKDVFSTFSGDSGNVHDFPEGGDLAGSSSMNTVYSPHIPKCKSVASDYADSLHKQEIYLQSQEQKYQRMDSTRSTSKKSMTELTDSGVSVVSDVVIKDVRLLNWLKDSDSKKGDTKHNKHTKKYSSQSTSLETAKQPFVADPGMPPLPQPHTPTQLEEAKRRLIQQEEDRIRSSRQRLNHKMSYEPMQSLQCNLQSSQSTLRRTKQDFTNNFTTVVFSFCDEQVPYRTKIPGHNVTLKQFKEFLPKKGNYRYFFKTECEDLDMKVIQEEITDDAEVLPLWEGKVMAQVKALE